MLTLLALVGVSYGADGHATIRQIAQGGGTITLEITLPAPQFDTSSAGVVSLKPLPEQIRSSDALAAVVFPILASRGASVRVVSVKTSEVRIANLSITRALTRDIALDATAKPSRSVPIVAESNHMAIGTARLSYLGVMRARGVAGLYVGAFDRTSGGLKYATSIVVQLRDPSPLSSLGNVTDLSAPMKANAAEFHAALRAELPSMKVQSDGDVQQTVGIQSADGRVYRMYIRQDGIYHITSADLKHFGIDPSTIDVSTLRLINEGQQVPIYLFDHQDGRFDPDDYFEFYGEAKKYEGPGTLGDFVLDPDTRNNVYYLVWGTKSPLPTGGLKRMVEETGEIRTADPNAYTDLDGRSFSTTIHFEPQVAAVSDNLEISDIDQRSDLRDHDFMGIIAGGENQTFETVVPFADGRENRPIYFRAALHGISHFDPGAVDAKGLPLPNIPNENEVEIAINGRSILHGTWDSQTLKFLATDTASQRIGPQPTAAMLVKEADSNGSIDPLDVTFWNRKDPSTLNGARVRFAVNWFDLTYDRLYWAYQDVLEFHAPQYTTNGLYQFTLHGFSHSDISIYRVGVSKITNAVFSENPKIPGSAKCVFQIHVSSDADKFIAVRDTAKLKPYGYAVDDYLDLRNPANQGAYLIITSHEHLKKDHPGTTIPLELLLQNRETQHHLTGKLIDVQNIYDEFRHGARSANAIRDFLKYAYLHWADPPRYVLLVGVTHPGDGDPVQFAFPDQVPAPYIQAFQEGATSADPWYTLLDGDDLIPDIALGRVASTGINQDEIYVEKVFDYEKDAATPGGWKDKLFLISVGTQFGDQADDMLVHSIPHEVFTTRMQTWRTDPYYATDQTLVDHFNDGIGSFIYLGHGGNGVWADPLDTLGRAVFTGYDLPRLHNSGKYPIILSLTCFTAGYDHTDIGILNGFLLTQSAGAVAAFGTTGFGWALNDALMGASVLPSLYDTVGGSFAERINAGKIEYLLRSLPGDLLPPTLAYCYHFLGDPVLSPNHPTDHVTLTLSTRTPQPGATEQITGKTSIETGEATIELTNRNLSSYVPQHIIENIPVQNGSFVVNDDVPTPQTDEGTYRVLVQESGSNRYAASSSDVTFTTSRISQLDYEPHPLPAGSDLTLTAAVQSPTTPDSVMANMSITRLDAVGNQSVIVIPPLRMSQVMDRYTATLSASNLQAGDRVQSYVTAFAGSDTTISDTIVIVVGAAADPSVHLDAHHPALTGGYRSGPNGLMWQNPIYNWGSANAPQPAVSLLDVSSGVPKLLGTTIASDIPAGGHVLASIPVTSQTLDTTAFALAIAPQAGSGSLELRDSLRSNDTTLPLVILPAAIAYSRTAGTTLDGNANAIVTFDSGEVSMTLPAGALGNIEHTVIRLQRVYDAPTTTQPDIHFLPMATVHNRRYTGIRITDDSLGAVPLYSSSTGNAILAVTINPSDTAIVAHRSDSLFVYRLDDRSHLWTKLPTARTAANRLTARITNLGTFAVAYCTDTRPPVVDIAIEGQIFSNNGEVPPQPHIQCVIQDANGIDVTPGALHVVLDGRTMQPSEYVLLDSGRTTTTVNLRIEPSLGSGSHTIAVQATDDNGNVNTPPTELAMHVSNEFSVSTLGSYPNPYTGDYMFIAYEIKGIAYAEEVDLDIYTVSGRKIRTLTFPSDDPNKSAGFLKGGTGLPTSLGYHEVWWDGRDNNLDDVANGPYYYRLTVRTNDDVRYVKGKFVRVR